MRVFLPFPYSPESDSCLDSATPEKGTNANEFSLSLFTAEDNMNVQLKDITVTARDGRVSHLDQVYIRGSHVRFFIVPDMLRYGSLQAQSRRNVSELECSGLENMWLVRRLTELKL